MYSLYFIVQHVHIYLLHVSKRKGQQCSTRTLSCVPDPLSFQIYINHFRQILLETNKLDVRVICNQVLLGIIIAEMIRGVRVQ